MYVMFSKLFIWTIYDVIFLNVLCVAELKTIVADKDSPYIAISNIIFPINKILIYVLWCNWPLYSFHIVVKSICICETGLGNLEKFIQVVPSSNYWWPATLMNIQSLDLNIQLSRKRYYSIKGKAMLVRDWFNHKLKVTS